ncbi:MAG: HD domain-containing protein [Deltaproteobacteria bacterium]|nr:HD domain-containing protein [Deltaproteobacteria bacterium]
MDTLRNKVSGKDERYIQIRPSLINFYRDLPVYIIHPQKGGLVRFLARKEQYAEKAISFLTKRGISVYVRLSDHKERNSLLEEKLVEYLDGPIDAEKAVFIKELTFQLVNEFFVGQAAPRGGHLIDAKSLKKIAKIANYYVGLLDLENAAEALEMIHNVILKDLTTYAHSVNTMILILRYLEQERKQYRDKISFPNELLANRHEIDQKQREQDRKWALGAILHDIGKVGIPDELLKAARKLTDKEYEIMKMHVDFGWEMIRAVSSAYSRDEIVKGAILHHHERLDGTGYPRKLTELSPAGQLIGLLDCYEALTTDKRPYRSAATPLEALDILLKDVKAGKFDPTLLKKLAELVANDHIA